MYPLGVYWVSMSQSPRPKEFQMSETRRYAVTGMSCAHCEQAIRQELSELPGVGEIQVSAADGSLVVTLGAEAPSDDAVLAAVDEAGYQGVRVP